MSTLIGHQIDDARRLALRQMLRLEMRGMTRSKGRSAYSILKTEHGYKGTRAQVLAELDAWRDQLLNNPTKGA
jgi:hypothetical protein